jgi:hypothetical protein
MAVCTELIWTGIECCRWPLVLVNYGQDRPCERCTASAVDGSVEHWWIDTDRGKRKYSEKELSECHCVHLKPHLCRERDRERQRRLSATPSSTNPVGRIIMTTESSSTQSTTCPNSTLSISNPIVKILLI